MTTPTRVASLAVAIALCACSGVRAQVQQPIETPGVQSWTCCNLRHEKNWISDHYLVARPFIPAGSKVTFAGWGRDRVNVEVAGVKVGAGGDYGHFRSTRETLAWLLFVQEDPNLRLATWPPEVQAAIRQGRIRIGMTRDQVHMALGPPRFEHTFSKTASNWVYMATEDGEFDLDFADDGTLRAINAPSRIRALVEAS